MVVITLSGFNLSSANSDEAAPLEGFSRSLSQKRSGAVSPACGMPLGKPVMA